MISVGRRGRTAEGLPKDRRRTAEGRPKDCRMTADLVSELAGLGGGLVVGGVGCQSEALSSPRACLPLAPILIQNSH